MGPEYLTLFPLVECYSECVHVRVCVCISLVWPDRFLMQGVIACSNKRPRQKGSGMIHICYLFLTPQGEC